MAKHGNPASDNGRPANAGYDHDKTKDVRDTASGRHSDEDKGNEDPGDEDKK